MLSQEDDRLLEYYQGEMTQGKNEKEFLHLMKKKQVVAGRTWQSLKSWYRKLTQ